MVKNDEVASNPMVNMQGTAIFVADRNLLVPEAPFEPSTHHKNQERISGETGSVSPTSLQISQKTERGASIPCKRG